MMKNAYLQKISILLQFGGEILALLYPDDSIQIPSIFVSVPNVKNRDKINRGGGGYSHIWAR